MTAYIVKQQQGNILIYMDKTDLHIGLISAWMGELSLSTLVLRECCF